MDTEVVSKINQIKQRLDQIYSKEKKKGKSSGYVIGLFTTTPQSDIAWIDTELRRDSENIKEIKYINATDFTKKDFDKAISECTFCIYISTEHKWKNVVTPSDRKKLFSRFGKKVLIVLIIDMEDISDEERSRIIKGQPGIKDHASDLILFRKIEAKPEKPQDTGINTDSTNSSQGGSLETGSYAINPDHYINRPYRLPSYRLPLPTLAPDGTGFQARISKNSIDKKHTVGIFSRSGEDDYAWLVRHLREAFQGFVGDVKNSYISNNGYQQLREDLSQCTFAILYHTKNRGRVNITDVKESLYDEELEIISAELGRRNVIVLIDDLEETNDEEKAQILETQPSINKLACDLILLSVSEKANKLRLGTKLKNLKFIFEGEYSGLKMQNTGIPDQHGRQPPNLHLPPQYPGNGSGNASPVQSRERIQNAVITPSKPTVAIYSKSEESDYSWLSQQLSSEGLDVRSYNITSLNKDQLRENAFQCKLVILYHNMHNGKLRLTDAKDAMYHEELETLSTKFGKRRMIVVIDDLVKSDDKIKAEILDRQPSTRKYATDIFLFSMEEKKHLNKKDATKEKRKMMDKISAIKEMLTK